MSSKNAQSYAFLAALLLGSLLVIAGLVALVMLRLGSSNQTQSADRVLPPPTEVTATALPQQPEPSPTVVVAAATATPEVGLPAQDTPVLTPRLLIDSDLGTGSQEFSAVALNEDANRLLIADDGDRLYEFDLDDAGLPITPVRRVLPVRVGAGDVEGLSWISGNTYVIAHEDDGILTVVTIDDDADAVTAEHLDRSIDSTIREERGNGVEGVAIVTHDPALEFVAVDERPPTIVGLAPDGRVAFSHELALDVTDLSDIYVSPTGTFSAITDEGRQIVNFMLSSDGSAVIEGRLDLTMRTGRFEQPEGLVRSRDGQRLYVVGEVPGPGMLTFGFWSAE